MQQMCTPLAPTRNKIIYKTACSDGPNSASRRPSQNRLRSKKASLVAFPVAISHKVSVDTKTLRFFNPDAKIFTKINLNTVPKMGSPGGPIFGTACTA